MPALPRISVVTVVRNSVITIEQAIKSVLAQDYENVEYIILDGASTDGTAEIIRNHANELGFWRSSPDQGPIAAYNEGIERATGEIIAYLNADDWYEPGILQKIGETFRAEPELDIVTCEARVWKKNPSGTMNMLRAISGPACEINPAATPMPNARFFKKTLFARYGNFIEKNHLGKRMISNDLEFLLRLSQHPVRNRVLATPGYNYLVHAGSITFGQNPERMKQMYLERAETAKHYIARGTLTAYRRRLARWHRRGTSRAFWWALREKKRTEAWKILKEGLEISGPLWLMDTMRLGLTGRYKL